MITIVWIAILVGVFWVLPITLIFVTHTWLTRRYPCIWSYFPFLKPLDLDTDTDGRLAIFVIIMFVFPFIFVIMEIAMLCKYKIKYKGRSVSSGTMVGNVTTLDTDYYSDFRDKIKDRLGDKKWL